MEENRKSLDYKRNRKTTQNYMVSTQTKVVVFPHLYLHPVYKVWVYGIQFKCLHFYTEQEKKSSPR